MGYVSRNTECSCNGIAEVVGAGVSFREVTQSDGLCGLLGLAVTEVFNAIVEAHVGKHDAV